MESAAVAHAGIAEAAAIGVPDPLKGEHVVVFCVPRSNASDELTHEVSEAITRSLVRTAPKARPSGERRSLVAAPASRPATSATNQYVARSPHSTRPGSDARGAVKPELPPVSHKASSLPRARIAAANGRRTVSSSPSTPIAPAT